MSDTYGLLRQCRYKRESVGIRGSLGILYFSVTSALKCFRCGKYTPDGAGSILPCYDYNHTDLRECRSSDKFCLKYLNKGIIVRDCVEKCESGTHTILTVSGRQAFSAIASSLLVHELSEFFCCDEDGCNGSPIIQVEWTVWILLFILIIFMHEMT